MPPKRKQAASPASPYPKAGKKQRTALPSKPPVSSKAGSLSNSSEPPVSEQLQARIAELETLLSLSKQQQKSDKNEFIREKKDLKSDSRSQTLVLEENHAKELESKRQFWKQQHAKLEKQITSLERELAGYKVAPKTYRKRADNFEEEIKRVNHELMGVNGRNLELTSDLADAEADVDMAQKELAENHITLATKENELAAAQVAINGRDARIIILEERIVELQAKVEEKRRHKECYKAAANQAFDKGKELKKHAKFYRERLAELEEEPKVNMEGEGEGEVRTRAPLQTVDGSWN